MNIDEWLQWPTKSTDPGVNFVVLVMLVMVIIVALVMGATILIPVLIVIGIAKGVHWYVNQPTPTDQLYAQTQQRSVSANFPDTEKFMKAYLDRFLDVIRDDLPAYHIYLMMARITEDRMSLFLRRRLALDVSARVTRMGRAEPHARRASHGRS